MMQILNHTKENNNWNPNCKTQIPFLNTETLTSKLLEGTEVEGNWPEQSLRNPSSNVTYDAGRAALASAFGRRCREYRRRLRFLFSGERDLVLFGKGGVVRWVGGCQVILDFLRLEWKFLASWNLQWSDVVSGFSRQ